MPYQLVTIYTSNADDTYAKLSSSVDDSPIYLYNDILGHDFDVTRDFEMARNFVMNALDTARQTKRCGWIIVKHEGDFVPTRYLTLFASHLVFDADKNIVAKNAFGINGESMTFDEVIAMVSKFNNLVRHEA